MARYKLDVTKKMDELLEVMSPRIPTALYLTEKQFKEYFKHANLDTYRNIPIEVVEDNK